MNYQEDENINTATHITVQNYSRIATDTLNNLVSHIYYDMTHDESIDADVYDVMIEMINHEVNIMTMKDAMLIIYAYEGDVMKELVEDYGDKCYSWKTMAHHILEQRLLKKMEE
jgi:hypothetical protein